LAAAQPEDLHERHPVPSPVGSLPPVIAADAAPVSWFCSRPLTLITGVRNSISTERMFRERSTFSWTTKRQKLFEPKGDIAP
jgi:hypothetical protein